MDVKSSGCPLGHKCEEVKTNDEGEQILYRCNWYVNIRGKNPQGEETLDQWGCAIAWMPILQIEGSQMTREATASIQSLRNEMVRGQLNVLKMTAMGELTNDPGNMAAPKSHL